MRAAPRLESVWRARMAFGLLITRHDASPVTSAKAENDGGSGVGWGYPTGEPAGCRRIVSPATGGSRQDPGTARVLAQRGAWPPPPPWPPAHRSDRDPPAAR